MWAKVTSSSDRLRPERCTPASCRGPAHKKRLYTQGHDGAEAYYKEVERPRIVADYFDVAQKIDVHNHVRQGSLCLEEVLGT